MASSVSGAFSTFRKDYVDLDPTITTSARSSRDFLIGQLQKLDGKVAGFPKLTGSSFYFGSFARKTKIRPLNDIDFLILLSSGGMAQVQSSNSIYKYRLQINGSSYLSSFADANGYVSSIRILNKISSSLPSVSQYQKAEIKRNQQAVVVNLTSYSWVFDVVPAVAVNDVWGTGISHYLIPDGSGDWIRTDPRKDSKSMTDANVRHGGNLLPVMRLLKYWNHRTVNKSRLPSYYFETLVLRTFANVYSITSIQDGLRHFFNNAPLYLNSNCPDPKGLGPNLDAGISADVKSKVDAAMRTAATHVSYAIMYEGKLEPQTAIYWWKQIFGSDFPNYG